MCAARLSSGVVRELLGSLDWSFGEPLGGLELSWSRLSRLERSWSHLGAVLGHLGWLCGHLRTVLGDLEMI